MKRLLLFAFGAALSTTAFGQHQLKPLWETKNLPVPESALYHADNKVLYVSLIDGDGATKDGKGGVAILNLDGSIKNQNWVTGMDAPKGLAYYKDLLYVADVTALRVVDLKTGQLLRSIEVPDAVFLNDVAVDDQGVVYVSDTRRGMVYQVVDNQPSVFLAEAPSANGLKVIGNDLYVLAGKELWKVDAQKQHQVIAKGFELTGDGLEPVGDQGDFLVTCWGGLVYYVKADGAIEQLMDVQGKWNTADIGIDSKTNTVYLPTFTGNSVQAFKLK